MLEHAELYKYQANDFEPSLFPDPYQAPGDWPMATGGILNLRFLLDAYSHGIFPWFSENRPIHWWSTHPRFVLFPDQLYINRTTKQFIKKKPYTFTLDRDFAAVISNCKDIDRKDQGTWITQDIVRSYIRLHRLGIAHSAEVWEDEKLVGGLYGVSLGRVFFGESMFSRAANASKLGMIFFTKILKDQGFDVIDAQVHTDYLQSLGAEMIDRAEFLDLLRQSLEQPTMQGNWGRILGQYTDSLIYG